MSALEWRVTPGGVAVRADELRLAETLACGQCFRWEESGGVWTGDACGRRISLRGRDGEILFPVERGEFTALWLPYFDGARDYAALRRDFSRMHPALAAACAFAPGIRILRQDPWEALCTFILSQNNNIPRIRGMVARLCACFGDPAPGGGQTFPRAERLANAAPEDLAPVRCGFRAGYLLSAARLVADGAVPLAEAARLPLDQARALLQTIHGVGPKVAECALLYGLHRLEAFPLDVWMKRAMAQLMPGVTPQALGPCAGVAQQYLYHYSRSHPALFSQSA